MNKLNTILDWVRYTNSVFTDAADEDKITFAHGCSNAFDEAHSLVLGLLKLPLNIDSSYFLAKLTDEEIELIKDGIKQRVKEKPVAYITNRTTFYGIDFYVDERVLIPRSPFMELISNKFMPYIDSVESVTSILDLCTGSGCIGIAASTEFPYATVCLADIDDGAIEVANKNISKHSLEHSIFTVKSDVFDGLKENKFDLIISNPPYVDIETVESLPNEFKHEPAIGLGSGDDGLEVTRKILKQAVNFLTETGLLFVEVGASWAILEESFPEISFNWCELENGEGIFMMSYDELIAYQDLF